MNVKIAVFTKNRTNPAYEAARLGAQTLHFVPEKGDDPEEQSALVNAALALSPDAIGFTPVHATRVKRGNRTYSRRDRRSSPLRIMGPAVRAAANSHPGGNPGMNT